MEHKAAAGDSGRAGARDEQRASRPSGDAGAGAASAETKQRVVRRRERADAAAGGDTSGRGAGFLPGLEALDDLPLELMGDDEDAESQLFSLLQRLRFAGTEAGASFGFDLCELALAVGAAQPDGTEAEAAAKQAEADGGEKAAAAEAPPAVKRDRTAARQRARFVKTLLASSLAANGARAMYRSLAGAHAMHQLVRAPVSVVRHAARAPAGAVAPAKRWMPLSCVASEPAGVTADAAADGPLYDSLDIRVGRVNKAWKHPEAEKLFVEEVDVGEPEPRQICSGLVGYVPEEELQGRLVVVLCNLKARNMRGVKSFGMLLAASDASHENVELLSPPAEAKVGERVRFGDAPQTGPDSENKVQKKKIWEAVQPDLRTSAAGAASWKDLPMLTSAGPVGVTRILNGNIA